MTIAQMFFILLTKTIINVTLQETRCGDDITMNVFDRAISKSGHSEKIDPVNVIDLKCIHYICSTSVTFM